MDLRTMMQLEPHGTDVWVGAGPRYPWGGLYGGQIVAQGLRAAAETVDPRFGVHSLHAYFVRRGDHDEPIRFEVDRTRNGRSFVTRRVEARQSVGAILTMSASFQLDEDGPDVQTAERVEVPPADQLGGDSWSPLFERRFARRRAAGDGRTVAWLRIQEEIGDDPLLQACALAYLSDDLPTDAVVSLHPRRAELDEGDEGYESFMSASLDHAIWFHRPAVCDRWHLHDFTSHGLLGSRGLSVGHVFTDGGIHVATIAQEVLLRAR